MRDRCAEAYVLAELVLTRGCGAMLASDAERRERGREVLYRLGSFSMSSTDLADGAMDCAVLTEPIGLRDG
eukprot:3941273-Rhodomonas_salina.6